MLRTAFRALLATVILAMPIAEASEKSLAVRLDALVQEGMSRTQTQGLAIAVIDDGKVELVKTWGRRNGNGDPLTADTVMYGASLTKAVFAYTVMQLAQEGKIDLDTPIASYLPKPLPNTPKKRRNTPHGSIWPVTNAGGN